MKYSRQWVSWRYSKRRGTLSFDYLMRADVVMHATGAVALALNLRAKRLRGPSHSG